MEHVTLHGKGQDIPTRKATFQAIYDEGMYCCQKRSQPGFTSLAGSDAQHLLELTDEIESVEIDLNMTAL